MNRKTLTALGIFVALAALALIALRQPEKGERAADHPHPIPKLSPVEITSLEVTRGGATTTIKNEGGRYRIAAPVAYAADEPAAKAAFEGLGKMDISDLVTEQKSKQAEFEVDDKSGIRLVAKHDDRVLADLVVGKSVGAGTMVRPSGQDETWRASGITRYAFDKSPADWRDKSIVTFPMADAAKLEVTAKDGSKIALQKAGATADGKAEKKPPAGDDKWAVTQSSVKIDKLDEAVPNGIASAMASWKANDFADGVSLADAGLAPPELTVTLGAKGGAPDKSVSILIGGKKGEDEVYVKKADAPQIFLVKKYNLERIAKRPMEFRDKTLCDVASADLTEIAVSAGDRSYTLVKSGSDWKAAKPAKLEIDASKVTPIAGGFKDWKGNGFSEDQSLKGNGLAKPKAVISVKAASQGKGKGMSSAPACQIRVGDETKDKINYYVASARSADVYTAPKWAVDRILVKPDELKSAANPGAAQIDKKPGAAKPVLAAKPAKK
jgi:hypothetical protein